MVARPAGKLVLVVRVWQWNRWAIGERCGTREIPHKLIRGSDPRSSQPRVVPRGPPGGHKKRIGKFKIGLAIEDCEAAPCRNTGCLCTGPSIVGGPR